MRNRVGAFDTYRHCRQDMFVSGLTAQLNWAVLLEVELKVDSMLDGFSWAKIGMVSAVYVWPINDYFRSIHFWPITLRM